MSGIWVRLARAWEIFWFSPGSAVNLAVARLLVAGTAWWFLWSRDLPALSGVPPVFWSNTPASFQWRYLLFPGHEGLERWLQSIAVAGLAATMLGIGHRAGALAAGLILLHLAPLESFQWSSSAFTLSIPILGLFFIAASPSADALSVRRWPAPPPSWRYHWPVQMIRVQLSLLYFFSGYSKLVEAGPSWAAPDHLQAWILGFAQREHPVYTSLAPWVVSQPWLCSAMGVGSLALELLFPLALVNRHARRVLLAATLAMHVGITLVLNITVLYWPVLLVFVDWDGVFRKVKVSRR